MAWVLLNSRPVTLTPLEMPSGWVKLDTRTIILTPLEEEVPPVGWVKLDTRTITLTPVEAPPIPPEYELVYTYNYPDAKTYVGKAEVCPFTFKCLPEQVPGHGWLASQIAKILGQTMIEKGEGSKMLRLQLWADTTPALWTNYYAEATATASPVPWALIIGAIAIIAVIASLVILVKEIKTIDWGKVAPAVFPIAAVIIGALVLGGIALVATRKRI